MGVRILWVRCVCGKLHATGGMTSTSKCTCGRDLWSLITAKQGSE
jgi:hypothetical protein